MAKKQKKTPVQKRTGAVTLLSLFCAAAGVYAESDGWSYNDVEKSVIHAGESHARIAPVKKGEELEDQSKIGNIKKAEISDNASFRYDPALGKDELKGVVFDNESGVQESASLKMSEGASLDVDATKSRDGKTDWSGKSAVGVEFAKDTTATIEAKDASISVKGDTGATAISASDPSTKLGNVEIGSVSAKATDSAKAFAINANDADSVKIGSVSGNIKVADAGTVDLGSMQGNIEAANVKDSISVAEKITGNITATSAKNVGIGEISGNVKIDTIGNSVNIDSLDGNLASTNVGNSSSESSVANITVKSASNTAREVNIGNLAATATISGDEENAEAAKINVGTAEKKLSVNGKVEARVDEAKGGLSAELKNADANALYVKSVKGGAEIAGEGNVNIVNAEASEAPAIKIGDLKGNFAAGVDSSAATSGAIKGDVEIGSISGNTGIINLDGNLTAGTLGADETSTTLIGVSGADKTVDITTANGTTTVNGNGSLEAKVGTSNGILTVNDYKKATIGEVKDGSKLVLNGSDKDAIADVTKADKVEANALGKTTIDSANYVKASDSIDASLSIKGQNVKITDASGEYVVDTKALANEGTVEINKGSIANSIDGFNGNVKANETGTIKVEGAGMTGGLDIGKINGDLTSAENAKISGNVNVGEVNKVDVKGGIAAIDGKENTGNLTIGTANDNVAVSGGVAGNMKVADAKKDVAVDTVGKNLTIDMLNGGTVKADEVTETVKVSAGTGSIEVAKAGNVDAATTDGKLTIDGQKVSTNGSLSIKGTEVAEGGQIHVGAIDIDSTVKGFKGDLTVDSNTGKIDVSTIDGILTVNDAQKDVNVSESAKAVNATLNGGDLNVSNAESNATVENVAVSGTGNVVIDNNTGSVDVGALGGKLTAKNAKGDINVATSATEIEATLNGGNINAENATVGSAKIGTAEGAQGNAVIGANTGSIDLVGTFSGKLTANNAQGDINIAEKATEVEAALNGGNIKGNEIGTITVKDNVDGSSSLGGIDVNKVDTIKLDGNLNGDIFVNEEVNKIDAESKKVTGDLILEKIASSANVGTVEGDINVSTLDKDAQLNVDTVLENTALGSTGKISVSDAQGNINVSNSVNEVDVVLNGGNLNVTNEAGTAEVVNNAVVSGTGNATIDKAKTIELGGDLKGNITVNTSVDTINGGAAGIGKTVDGNVDVEQNTGSITLGNVTGELKLGDAQGNVDVFQKAGNVDAMLNGGQLRVSQVDEDGTAKVDGQGKAIIGKASSIEANTSNGNFHLDGNNLQIEGGTLDVDVANVSKKEDGTVAEVKATGALDSVEIKNVNDGTNVSFNDVTKANGGTGNVDITDSKLGTVSASGTVEGDFNVTNVEGNIASTGEIQGTTNIADFKGDASFNTVKDVNVNSSDPDNKKGLDGSLTIAQGQGAVTFNADAGTVDINLDGGSVTTGLKPNGDAVVLDKANFSGNGTVNVTVDKLESFDQINDSVEINRKKLTSGGKLNSQITVNSGEFTITNADSITVDGHNENGGRKLAIENKITDDVTIGRIGKDGVAVAAENATIGGNLDIGTADGSVTVGTVNGKTKIDTANGKTEITTATDDVSIATANDLVKVDNGTNVSVVNGKDVTVGEISGALKVDKGNAIKVDTKAGSLDLGTVASVKAGAVDNNVDIDNVGAVDIDSVGGQTTIGAATDNVTLGTAKNVTIGDIAEGKVATIGTAGDIDINGKGSLKVENEANNITAGNIKQVSVKTANGDIKIITADDLTFTTVEGNVNVSSEIKTVNGGNVNGDVSIAKNTGNVELLGTVNNLILSNVAGGSSVVNKVKNKAEITTTAGSATIKESKQLQGTVDGGALTANTVSDIANITVNSGTANVGSAKSLDATVNGGSLNVDSVASSSNATVKANGGEVEVAKNTGNVEISGSGDATVKDSTGSLEVATSTADKFVKNTNGGISTKGNLNVAIDKATSANFGTVNGGDIVDMTKIDNLTVSESTGILNVGLEGGQVKGNIVIEKATADVNVGNVANLDVTLRNNANLLAIDNTKVDAARVNGGCDASYYNVGTLKVDRSLDGNLEVRGAVSNSADINNVSGTVAINEVASTATASVKNAGSAIVDKANGNVEFFDFASGSATVNNATAKIEATNIAGGLNIGNVKDVKVNNTNVNVLDGNTVNGKIESTSDMTLSNSGTATIGNSGQIVVNGDLNVASEFKFAESTRNGAVIKANNLSGSGATKTVDNFFDAKFGFSGDDSVMEAAALKGTHNAGSSYIDANIDDMSVSHTYVDVTYKNTDGSSKVGYEITKNSYLSDKFAKSDNEKALAEIYDNLVFQDDATKDGESVQKKKNFKALAENGNIGAMLPQAVNHAARMNMDLSNMIHLDTINRTAYTRDMLNRINYLKAKGKLRGRHSDVLSGASSVTVRNINRFASYSGDGNIAGSNDSVYGGLANAEYVFDDSLFAGIGIGGFQAKSNGKDASGKAETQSFALNAYADYLFYDNFDWYFGLTYAYGMNEAERNSGSSMNKGKWNSNLVGAFTGVRYAWKPIADREFYIKPLLGMNVSFLMNPSFTENGDSERLDVDSEDYTSVKSIAGIEASYLLDCGLSVAGRMFYAHEFADNRYDITSSFIGSGYSVNTFRTLGSEIKRDTGIFGIGLGYDINTDWRVYLDYAAEVADDVYHNLNAGVQFKF